MVFHYRLSDFLQPSQQNMRLTGTPQCGHISRACINFSLISENPVFDVSPGRSERLGGLALSTTNHEDSCQTQDSAEG